MANYYNSGLSDGMQQSMYDSYGAAMGPKAQAGPFVRGQRRRLNLVAVVLSLFAPWLIFTVVFGIMSFSMHYQQPPMAYTIVGLALLIVVGIGLMAADAAKQKANNDPRAEPSWYIFMFATGLIAWILGVVFGDMNFFQNMQPFYDVMNLNSYPSVDPSRMHGQQLMDAGQMVFTESSKLDIQKSMGFKNLDLYCVAPVTIVDENRTTSTLMNYDFWAVGVNCCSGDTPDFHCGEFNNPMARAGLRLMRDDQRAFFRLAVQQAEAAYNIQAVHPLFLYWMQDPMAEVSAYQDDGYKYYLLGMFSHFALQLFLVVAATIVFSKIGQL